MYFDGADLMNVTAGGGLVVPDVVIVFKTIGPSFSFDGMDHDANEFLVAIK